MLMRAFYLYILLSDTWIYISVTCIYSCNININNRYLLKVIGHVNISALIIILMGTLIYKNRIIIYFNDKQFWQ